MPSIGYKYFKEYCVFIYIAHLFVKISKE